jgi:hypothetical protein
LRNFSSNWPKPRNKINISRPDCRASRSVDETSNQLQNAKFTGVNSEETASWRKKTNSCESIVVRERQEEARRYQAKRADAGGVG